MLHNWPIRTKLIVILVIPLAALAVLSAIQVRGNVDNVRASDRVGVLADFSITSSDLVHVVQQERHASGIYLGSEYQNGAEGIAPTRRAVDAAVAEYRAAEAKLPASTRESVTPALAAIDARIVKLAGHRKQFDGRRLEREQNIGFYTAMVTDLLALETQIGNGSRNAELVGRAATLASVSHAKEASALQQGHVAALLFNAVDPMLTTSIQNEGGLESAFLTQFRNTATDEERRFYDTTVGPTAERADATRDGTIFAVVQGQRPGADPFAWLKISQTKLDKMREVERFVARNLAETSEGIAADATRNAWSNSLAVALVLGLSVAVSLLVASPMIRQLRRLRGAALDVAGSRLPSVVERLHRGDPVDMAEEAFPVSVRSKDEIGQLSDAFGTVHRVAVHTAIEQAAMRKSIGDTFLNLARRSQALIHRQLKIIDALERKEADPDELDELFRLDHLATRMRRHAEDLIVLSGSKPARGWRRPVPVKDVIRGAVAEVEDYTRVKVLPVSAGAISGHAVGDVIHMLAELIENATSFSPPHTPVHVSGHDVSNGCAIEVEDRGLGMTEEEFAAINTRLANPPPFDLTTSERLGLFVVGRLAERHGIQVRLRSSPYGGTMAIVLVPVSLMRAETDHASAGSEDGAAGSPDDASRLEVETSATVTDARELAPVGALPAPPVPPPRVSAPDGVPAVASYQPAPDDGYAPAHHGEHKVDQKAESDDGNADDRPLMDDLPVFATVRSSWFIADRSRTPANRRWPLSGPDRAELGGGSPPPLTGGGGQSGSPSAAEPSAPVGEPTVRRVPPLGPQAETGSGGQGAGRGNGRGAAHRPPPTNETTDVGLPKRRRRASLAPQLRRDDTEENPSPAVLAGGPRSPEEVRTMMTSFQANFGRGLADGQVTDDDGQTT
jgi:signal transduction histidine kinase